MKRKTKKKLNKIIGRALRHPDNFSLEDLAKLILAKREDIRYQAAVADMADELKELMGKAKHAGFRA
jgi:hypothetical protein